MKRRVLLTIATGVLATMGTAVWVLACDKEAKTQASAAAFQSHACTAAMAAKCTPEQAAACKAKGANAVAAAKFAGTCSHSGAAATAIYTASSSGCAHGAKSAAAKAACKNGASATTALSNSDEVTAVPAGGGYSCGGKGMTTTADRFKHEGCDACADMNDCDGELKASGALTQVVKLKNGIMYVYTAHDPGKVRAVQAAVSHRNERLTAMHASGDKVKLCPDCKVMRGAVASGKLTREMVTIEGGCLTLVTSTDAAIVNKLHAMVGQQSARAKI